MRSLGRELRECRYDAPAYLRLMASGYVGLVQWWVAMLDGIVTAEERRSIVRAVVLVE
jgi:hypothetical protein